MKLYFSLTAFFVILSAGDLDGLSEAVLEAISRSTTLQKSDDFYGAEQALKTALRRSQASPMERSILQNELALVLQLRDNFLDAERHFTRAFESAAGQPDAETWRRRIRLNLAALYVETHRPEKTRLQLEQLDPVALEPPDIDQYRSLQASLAVMDGDLARGKRLHLENLHAMKARATSSRYRVDIATTQNNIGAIAVRQSDWPEAARWLAQAADGFRSEVGPNAPSLMKTLANLGTAHMKNRDFQSAKSSLGEACEIARVSLGRTHPLTIAFSERYADILSRTGQSAMAKALKREVREARATLARTATVDVSELSAFRPSAPADKTGISRTRKLPELQGR
ncbi:MAG: tetratricopeptide repeat protein [Bryobacteraceae bacterium]|nr:tetratricopeptide repeat protein [Bryobacteraceae bacterium]